MPDVVGTIRDPDGTLAGGTVSFQLVGAAGRPQEVAYLPGSDQTIEGTSTVELTSGAYSVALPSNDLIIPAGTRWARSHKRSGRVLLHVTETPATQREEDILADPPGALASAALSAHAASLTAHGNPLASAVQLVGDQSIAGTKTFDVSPIVPNPAVPAGPAAAASVGEVQDLIAAEPMLTGSETLHVGNLGARGVFAPIGNTTAETSLLSAVFPMPALAAGAVFRFVAAGQMANNSGGNVTFTFRARAAGALLAASAVTLATDALTTRGWRYTAEGDSLGGGVVSLIGGVLVAAGTTDGIKQIVTADLASGGAAPQNWDLSVQMSVANAAATVTAFHASVQYGIPA